MADLGMPSIDIIFTGLGASAVQRSQGGRTAVLIIKDDTDNTFTFNEYISIDDLTNLEQAKYTPGNLQFIKDALGGTPKKLVVARMDETLGVLADLLTDIKGKVEMNCWIGVADGTQQEQDDLVSFVTSNNELNKKRYKALVYKATSSDDKHIVNFTNEGEEGSIAYLLGYLAGLSLDISSIAKVLKMKSVIEPADLGVAINNGEFILYNDEGEVRVARGINSLVTTGQGVTDDMKFILIVEVMDMIYTDIYTTWKKFYKGKYKNSLDNQMLLIGAINSYFTALEDDLLLDRNFDNKSMIDVNEQRLANIPKYGETEVAKWDNDKVMEMTYGTNVFLTGNIKILNAMEDFKFKISM
ncbi:phage tail sheath C-terminal domain-containing protein [Tissierella creatinophila]|uniref:Phage tail sheath protein n=1 Tax=Tissierella creatinophila DSM 6911 TaxID=1123403 RepID=A0A1U7M567_TISCR|nr:phage tail sheath C-terminal domain-containing protein [Tissierella creatinophila]OLS02425.1 phage tail sheath protein [Tissierella creatinophila DSM 6911]